MPARTPEEVHPQFMEAFNAGDLDALLAVYEPEASMVPEPGQVVTGAEAIRQILTGFLALKGTIAITTRTVVPAGELALVHGEWTLNGTGPDGQPLALAGRTSEVVRRQPDGTWRYVIDNPYSADR